MRTIGSNLLRIGVELQKRSKHPNISVQRNMGFFLLGTFDRDEEIGTLDQLESLANYFGFSVDDALAGTKYEGEGRKLLPRSKPKGKENAPRMTFGERIKKLREARGISAKELAGLVPISLGNIYRFENGQSDPDLSTIERLAEALHTTPSALCGWDEARNTTSTTQAPSTTQDVRKETPIMLYSEFTERTGFYPTMDLYRAIEKEYMQFDGDKDAFCKAYRENQNGMAVAIAHDAEMQDFLHNEKENRRVRIERDQNARQIERLEQKVKELEDRLEREMEWKPKEPDTAMSQADYERLAGDSTAKHLTTEEAADLIAKEFGFDREKIGIVRQLHKTEINRHHGLRVVGSIQRDPLFDAWDWNYIAFKVNGNATMHYEMVNGELYLR